MCNVSGLIDKIRIIINKLLVAKGMKFSKSPEMSLVAMADQ